MAKKSKLDRALTLEAPEGRKRPNQQHNFGAAMQAVIDGKNDRQDRFERYVLEDGMTVTEACQAMPMAFGTYLRWRTRYPEWKDRFDARRRTKMDLHGEGAVTDFATDFAGFRKRYFDMDTTWFQMSAVKALEECKPGEIILMLWPPEHGKTTTIEDFCNWKLAHTPNTRISVVSEKQAHGKKVLRRVRNRMEPTGPCQDYVLRYGPFAPISGEGAREMPQPWTDAFFDIRQRGSQFDERDYSMSAVGIKTGVQGTRADWMIIDDVQSLKSLNLSKEYVEILRQDFFSRPGMKGRICILGTRVGMADVYEELMEEGLIDRLIVFPAIDADGEYLWPEHYSAEEYTKMERRVGPQAWSRNYMQQPTSAKEQIFTKEMVDLCLNAQRSVISTSPRSEGTVTSVVVSVDPSLGGANCTGAFGLLPDKFVYLSSRVDHDLTRTDQLFDIIEETIIRWNEPGVSKVTSVVIEAMAFQRGLLTDTRMNEIIRRYKVDALPHMTGINKYDPNIGIPSMALSWQRGEWDFPYADVASQREVDALLAEAYAWRPYKRGTRLVQDRVMMAWFAWLRWRGDRAVNVVDMDAFRREASPLATRYGT